MTVHLQSFQNIPFHAWETVWRACCILTVGRPFRRIHPQRKALLKRTVLLNSNESDAGPFMRKIIKNNHLDCTTVQFGTFRAQRTVVPNQKIFVQASPSSASYRSAFQYSSLISRRTLARFKGWNVAKSALTFGKNRVTRNLPDALTASAYRSKWRWVHYPHLLHATSLLLWLHLYN